MESYFKEVLKISIDNLRRKLSIEIDKLNSLFQVKSRHHINLLPTLKSYNYDYVDIKEVIVNNFLN